MIFYGGLGLILAVGASVIVGLIILVRTDLEKRSRTSTPVGPDASVASADKSQEGLPRVWRSYLLTALAPRGKGLWAVLDPLMYLLVSELERAHEVLVETEGSGTLLPNWTNLNEVVSAPIEELELTVGVYNAVKRLGLHDLTQLLTESVTVLTEPSSGLAPEQLDELGRAVVDYLVKRTGTVSSKSEDYPQVVSRRERGADTDTLRAEIFGETDGTWRIWLRTGNADWLEVPTSYESGEAALRALNDMSAEITIRSLGISVRDIS